MVANRKWMQSLLVAASVVVAISSVPAMAADLPPVFGAPSWWRLPGDAPDGVTRTQYHSFHEDPTGQPTPDYTYDGFVPAIPDAYSYSAGTAFNLFNPPPIGHGNPLAGDDVDMLVPAGGFFAKRMGNLAVSENVKQFFVQMVYRGQQGIPGVDPLLNVLSQGMVAIDTETVDPLTADGSWLVKTWTGTITPQPDVETFEFLFPAPTLVDSLWIGTHCVPEPSALGLLAIGGLAVLRRRG